MATPPSKIGPLLWQLLLHPSNSPVTVNISLDLEPASLFAQHPEARQLAQPARSLALQRIAQIVRDSQKDLIDSLDGVAVGTVRSLWINNVVTANLPIAAVVDVLGRDDVRYVEVNNKVRVKDLLDHARPTKKTDQKKKNRSTRNKKKPPRKNPDEYSPPSNPVPLISNLDVIGAPALWELGLTGKGILVAVIDTGINYDHPHLTARMWDGGAAFPNHGRNTALNNDETKDIDGHGTACAGIIAGSDTGVARDATLMIINVVDTTEDDSDIKVTTQQPIWDGMQFALDQGCHLVSASVSVKQSEHPNNPAWRSACATLYEANILHVNSTGKHGEYAGKPSSDLAIPNNIPAPANCPPPWLSAAQQALAEGGLNAMVACGASNCLDKLVYYSGWGPSTWDDYLYTAGTDSGLLKPDLSAPGIDIPTCARDGGLRRRGFSGTSAATPQVAGVIALLMHACLNAGVLAMPIAQILEALSTTCDALVGQTAAGVQENGYGAGRINALAAHTKGVNMGWW